MPQSFQGKPSIEQERDPRTSIHPGDEARLLGLAVQRGLEDANIGVFFVVMVADLPYVVSDNEYQTFSAEELKSQAEIEAGWFYDSENNRLIGTIPPTRKIMEALQNSR